MENCVPANNVLRLMVDHHEGWKPDPSWMRWHRRPQRTWLHHIQQDKGVIPSIIGILKLQGGMEQRNGHRLRDNDDDDDDDDILTNFQVFPLVTESRHTGRSS